jgi:glycosyltransferase involved in cell wall biosynthesis
MLPTSLVSFIIPAYNEEETIGEVITETTQVMRSLGLNYEIIVINDGSTDKTEFAASTSDSDVTVFSNTTKRGKGYCIRLGAKHAIGNILVTLDSDGEHKPKEIPDLLAPLLKGADIVAGSRFLGNSGEVTSKVNIVGNALFNIAIMILTGHLVSDSQTGFRAIKKEVFEKLDLQSDGFDIESEITVKSLLNGFTFKEIPITVERRKYNISKIKLISDGRKILTTIIRSSLFNVE